MFSYIFISLFFIFFWILGFFQVFKGTFDIYTWVMNSFTKFLYTMSHIMSNFSKVNITLPLFYDNMLQKNMWRLSEEEKNRIMETF